jgi:hypothetical protein
MDGRGSRAVARTSFWGGALSLVALALAGCSVAATPSPETESTAETPAATASAETPGPSGSVIDILPSASSAPTASEPTLDPDAEPSDSPTPPLPNGTLPKVKAAPADPWTAIKWIALPGGHYPAVPKGEGAGDGNATVVGWHGGYIEFLWDPEGRTLTPWVSGNGLTWRAGPRMDLSSFATDFKAIDDQASQTPEPGESPFPSGEADEIRYGCSFVKDQFEEGPSTVLLRGFLHCGDACGHPMTMNDDSIWVSSDGLVWSPVDVKKAFGGAEPDLISGGSSGFVAYAGSNLWISEDGRTWRTGTMPAGTNRSQPVSMAGGFVIGDAVVMVKGHDDLSEPGYCTQSGADKAKYRAEFWLSSDGINWTATHTGIVGYGVSVQMTRLHDHLVVAYETDGTHEYQLVSRDGRNWTQFKAPVIDYWSVLAGRDQGFVCRDTDDSGTALLTFDSNQRLITVKQTGDVPWDGILPESWAIGPTGVLATADGERFWIGVPSAG